MPNLYDVDLELWQ